MNIRKYTLIAIISMVLILVFSIVSYQLYFSYKPERAVEELEDYDRFVRTEDGKIKIYEDGSWKSFKVKGVELTSFQPGYARFKSSIEKKDVRAWLESIGRMNANLIKVPYIQPSSFYDALYDYNLDREDPIYLIHEIPLDERALLKEYDAFDEKIVKNLKKDIKNTVDLINGRGLILGNKRGHRGVYLKDISNYNLGYIIGTNTNPELVTLTDVSKKGMERYKGKYYSSQGSPFESFIGEILDFTADYEIDKYDRLSLLSFLTSVETDPLEYKHESNLTKHANINLENIEVGGLENLFVSYKFHPNEADFLDYEYGDELDKDGEDEKLDFTRHLERLNDFYRIPVLVSDTGISTSRAISKVDKRDGFNRGGFTEKEQGEKIVSLLEGIYKSGSAGAVINSWQDNWTNLTSFNLIQDYRDSSASSYWQDFQSSDESFGLMKFQAGEEEEKEYLDGDLSQWKDTKLLLDEDIKLKAKSDSSNLYIYLEKEDWSLNDDSLYIGLNISPFSGSKVWKGEAEFSSPVDFIVRLNGYNESRIVVNERYNLFNYMYKYYSNIIDKEDKVPEADSESFNAIYLLNRNKFEMKNSEENLPPVYYETGRLLHGNDNPASSDFNSLADFNKTGDALEIKIPWTLINIKNPLDKKAYGDFYLEGIGSQIDLKEIGINLYFKSGQGEKVWDQVDYSMEKLKNEESFEKIKDSYGIIKNYWELNPDK